MQEANIFNPPLPSNEDAFWQNLQGASVGLALSNLIAQNQHPFLIIAPDNLSLTNLVAELQFFHGNTQNIVPFPDWETLPYDHFSPHQDIVSDRLAALSRMPFLQQGAIISTINTLMHHLPPLDFLSGQSFLLKVGDKLNLDQLRERLTKASYYAVGQVRDPGEFAIRGSLIDLFPMGSKTPFRIDLFDNEVDSIRLFSTETQRSLEKINEIHLLPAKEFPLTDAAIENFRQRFREQFSGNPLKCSVYQDISDGISSPGIEYYFPLFFKETATIVDYLPANTTIVLLGEINSKAEESWQEINKRYELGRYDITRPLLSPEQLFISNTHFFTLLKSFTQIHVNSMKKNHSFDFHTASLPSVTIQHRAEKPLTALQTFLQTFNGRVLFCAESTGRREVLLQLFKSIVLAGKAEKTEKNFLSPMHFESWSAFLVSDAKYGMVIAPIEQGFLLENPQLAVITETQLYDNRVMQRRLRKKSIQDPDAIVRDLTELNIGDPIVHIQHGVGRYLGLQTLTVNNQVAEFLTLEYQGGDKLYVPVASLHLVSRYTGTNQESAPLNKLGTDHWQRAKRKAAKKARDVAAELLDLYARRAARPGHAYQLPLEAYTTFSAQFPFEETPDQLQAIDQVFSDMSAEKPMDRVICGDVGFGKTEVALRAAFLAAQNSKQVAMLVPTTLLAQQHFQTFQDRFADWPINIEMLSRFRTTKEEKNILQRLTQGKVDIVIGTHKLLQSDIAFKSLGLIIIDEEHRFGVKQKEKLKALRAMVDILTLTATPIPRTLNMSLSGIRDLSIIATPPAKRLSVKTFVHEYQDSLIQEAIQREVMRGGQVYFLHNEVTTIAKKAQDLAALVPEARVAVAHGQMHERDLERIMAEFYHRHYNVLVCSTIIESGIDIPTANTIIINRADKFGLAQLHQLRGRVGRSHHQAYAYLLSPPRKSITPDAVRRLDAIASLDQLGIGFTLATHDLEIRGAGELLGEEQSGDMQEIGFTLYMDLLTRAVNSLKAGKEPDFEKALLQQNTEIDLHVSALIPENYLGDVQLRLQCYKRIASANTQSELDEVQVDMIDRFGLLPPETKNLIAISELRLTANKLGIIKIETNEKGGKFEFNEQPNIKAETIIKLIQKESQQFKLEGPSRLRFTLSPHKETERIQLVTDLLMRLT